MIPKSFLIYKNDKLDLCKTLAIIEERLELPSQWSKTTWQAKLYMTNCGMTT